MKEKVENSIIIIQFTQQCGMNMSVDKGKVKSWRQTEKNLPLANGTASDDSHNNARSPSSSISCSGCVGSCSVRI